MNKTQIRELLNDYIEETLTSLETVYGQENFNILEIVEEIQLNVEEDVKAGIIKN